ncbi:MAG TPA: host attachment protein [Opitutaceae bacterium]|jgi:hypothetical protein|nr:host attachment protein [Opitutaceae bacterium]
MKPIDMPEASGGASHFIAVVDRVHVRIFQETSAPGQARRGLRLVEALDVLGGRGRVGDRVTDEAGRFPGGQSGSGGGIDERLPMRREGQRRLAADVAGRLSDFFRGRREASWDLAVAKGIFHQVIAQIDPAARGRLRRALAKDLTNQPPETLREHFAAAIALAAR